MPLRDEERHELFLPMMLMAVALVSWFGLQTYELAGNRKQLTTIMATQDTQVAAAMKIRTALDSLAADTQRLANAGNTNARVIVEELHKRGVTINTEPKVAAAAR